LDRRGAEAVAATDGGVQAAILGPTRGDPAYVRGVALTLFTAVAWSGSGVVWRHIEAAPVWTLIFYRSLGLAVALAIILLVRYRTRFFSACRSIGYGGAAAGTCLGVGTCCFLFAVMNTTIANVAFLTATTPLFAALLGWVLLGERVHRRTWVAMIVALSGVLVMVIEGIAGGGWFGNLMAIGSALSGAGYAVALRFGRQADQMPAVMLGGVVSFMIAAPFMSDFHISGRDLALCLTQGMAISAMCNVIFAFCARVVPAAEMCLLSLLEAVLSPTWVWLVVGEKPSDLTLLGGAIVFAAVVGYTLSAVRAMERA
jgi:drug/metabolite transporter (DMT)-like permease